MMRVRLCKQMMRLNWFMNLHKTWLNTIDQTTPGLTIKPGFSMLKINDKTIHYIFNIDYTPESDYSIHYVLNIYIY